MGSLILLPLFLRMFNPSFIYKNRETKNNTSDAKGKKEAVNTVKQGAIL
jgi:hypothetical protein